MTLRYKLEQKKVIKTELVISSKEYQVCPLCNLAIDSVKQFNAICHCKKIGVVSTFLIAFWGYFFNLTELRVFLPCRI